MRFFAIAIVTSLLLATADVWAQGGHGHGRGGMSVVDLLLAIRTATA